MSSTREAEAIVIGLGSMGLAACYHLAKSGIKTIGLERFSIYNQLSSHSGETRLIRKSYFEHPDYVPLLHQAYDHWSALERLSGNKIFHRTGLAYMGKKEGDILSGVLNSAQLHHIHIEEKWMKPFDSTVADNALWEADAGFLDVSEVFHAYQKLALEDGAIMNENVKVKHWEQIGEKILVQTDQGDFSCDKLVITAGAWTKQLLPQLRQLRSTRQVLAWFDHDDRAMDLPCWCLDHPGGLGIYYGFSRSSKGFKIGHHYAGPTIHPDEPPIEITKQEIKELQGVLNHLVTKGQFTFTSAANCIYTYTPDEHFVIDFVPGSDQKVVVAAGFSGHGFKFVSAVGPILSEMVVDQQRTGDAEFFSLDRFG